MILWILIIVLIAFDIFKNLKKLEGESSAYLIKAFKRFIILDIVIIGLVSAFMIIGVLASENRKLMVYLNQLILMTIVAKTLMSMRVNNKIRDGEI